MAFDKNFFCLHGGRYTVSGQQGGSACTFGFPAFKGHPGCAPIGSYWHAPYHDNGIRDEPSANINGKFTWQFPRAASLSQLVVSSWGIVHPYFGKSDDRMGTSMSMVLLDDTQLITATKNGATAWTQAERIADRGTVWDINAVVEKGATASIEYRSYRAADEAHNAFVMSITGSWLR